jgi:acyl carrier protein
MELEEVRPRLRKVFRDLFDDPELEISDPMTAADIKGWDSLTHINLIVSVEKEFKIKLSTGEVRGLKNVGNFIALIARKAR